MNRNNNTLPNTPSNHQFENWELLYQARREGERARAVKHLAFDFSESNLR
jgi:hypothetical protein